MADKQQVVTSDTLLYTGTGQLMGLTVTSTSGAPKITIYDGVDAGGTKIYEATVHYLGGIHLFFAERFAPIFTTGLYLDLEANLTAVIWWREVG
ncbi:MAG: hypothetical protein WAV05_11910 [Anaerolineales bacterium]